MSTDWDAYAQTHPIGKDQYRAEETQWLRVQKLLDRCVGSVLDVGGGDGWIARQLMDRGHEVLMVESSVERVRRAQLLGVTAICTHGNGLADNRLNKEYDTVLLGEVLEHLDDPGQLLRDAFRIARERVIITVPLLGWADPTHQWRISLDHFATPDTRWGRPPSSEQVVMTWQRGECWPLNYHQTDAGWKAQFEDGR